jgi:hypothetical protein
MHNDLITSKSLLIYLLLLAKAPSNAWGCDICGKIPLCVAALRRTHNVPTSSFTAFLVNRKNNTDIHQFEHLWTAIILVYENDND